MKKLPHTKGDFGSTKIDILEYFLFTEPHVFGSYRVYHALKKPLGISSRTSIYRPIEQMTNASILTKTPDDKYMLAVSNFNEKGLFWDRVCKSTYKPHIKKNHKRHQELIRKLEEYSNEVRDQEVTTQVNINEMLIRDRIWWLDSPNSLRSQMENIKWQINLDKEKALFTESNFQKDALILSLMGFLFANDMKTGASLIREFLSDAEVLKKDELLIKYQKRLDDLEEQLKKSPTEEMMSNKLKEDALKVKNTRLRYTYTFLAKFMKPHEEKLTN